MPIVLPTSASARNVDKDPKFHAYLRRYLESQGVPQWTKPKAEVMKQRLQRYMHVVRFEGALENWRTSLVNSSYDVPADWNGAMYLSHYA